jgi:hypothetical protein
VWTLYALIPLLLIPTGRGIDAAAARAAPRLGRLTLWFATLSAGAMLVGLARWPTLQWSLAETWPTADSAARQAMTTTFDRANLYLGNLIGEFLGELFLNGFFLAATLALSVVRTRHWLLIGGLAASALGFVAMLRNLAPFVAPAAALNNIVLPVWMLVLGVALFTTRE